MEKVYIFNTPDVPGYDFIAGRCENICEELEGTNIEDVNESISVVFAKAQRIAAEEGYNCIVNFNPTPIPYSAGSKTWTLINANFTMGNVFNKNTI